MTTEQEQTDLQELREALAELIGDFSKAVFSGEYTKEFLKQAQQEFSVFAEALAKLCE